MTLIQTVIEIEAIHGSKEAVAVKYAEETRNLQERFSLSCDNNVAAFTVNSYEKSSST